MFWLAVIGGMIGGAIVGRHLAEPRFSHENFDDYVKRVAPGDYHLIQVHSSRNNYHQTAEHESGRINAIRKAHLAEHSRLYPVAKRRWILMGMISGGFLGLVGSFLLCVLADGIIATLLKMDENLQFLVDKEKSNE